MTVIPEELQRKWIILVPMTIVTKLLIQRTPSPKEFQSSSPQYTLLIEAEPICACTPALAIITYELL